MDNLDTFARISVSANRQDCVYYGMVDVRATEELYVHDFRTQHNIRTVAYVSTM
jgi:hypothetical protein